MPYVDGFLIAVPKRNLTRYRAMSRKAGKVWKEYGALEYRECVGEDLKVKHVVSFIRSARARKGEVVIFSWIVYRSKAARDRINKKVMADPRLFSMMETASVFDPKRMAYGGFKVIVDL